MSDSPHSTSKCTDFIDIAEYLNAVRQAKIVVTGSTQWNNCIVAYYDEDKMFLGGVKYNDDVRLENEVIELSDITSQYPTVRFVRFSTLNSTSYMRAEIHYKKTQTEYLADSNVLFGKKWIACGDSFTRGGSPLQYDKDMKTYQTYPWFIAQRNGMDLNMAAVDG